VIPGMFRLPVFACSAVYRKQSKAWWRACLPRVAM
jgi:hypothetical protein